MFAAITSAEERSRNLADYKIIALSDCAIVSEKVMTQEQLDAYLPLIDMENLMQDLQVPMDEMEEQLEVYTDQIEAMTELAVHETDDSIYIDKTYLSQQKELADKIRSVVSSYQTDITAIETHGEAIGEKAKVFERAVKSSLVDVDYDQIRIISPTNHLNYGDCA